MPRAQAPRSAPGALPLLGHALQLVRDPVAFLRSLPAHGDLVEVRLGPVRAYAACDPELAYHVLSDVKTFDKGGPFYDKARQEAGNGIVNCLNSEHPQQRQLVWPAFHRSRLPAYSATMADHITRAVTSWHHGQTLDLVPQTSAITAAVTANVMFAHQADDLIAGFAQSSSILLEGLYRRMVLPSAMLERLPIPGSQRHRRARRRLTEIIDEIISGHDGTDRGDLLSMLLNARASGQSLTPAQLHHQVFNVFIAGTDTIASTLAWALYLVATHPSVQQQLHAEADAVLGGRPPTYDDIPDLPVTTRILNETLRLYPSAWLLTRVTTGDTELAGHRLPANTTIVCSPYLIHHRADIYPRPEHFDPDRWLHQPPPHPPRPTYIPFGAGTRQCIGRHFGITEATLALATIATHWHLRPAATAPVRPLPRATMGARTMPVHLQRRAKPPTGTERP